MDIDTRTLRGMAACLIAGSMAAGSAVAETNWGALSTADWGGGQAAATLAQGGGAGSDWSAAIQRAFVDLGMAEPRAECYGKVLAEKLSPEGQQAAAQLVDDATTADEVKLSVISGGPEMVGGFSAADVSCPDSMGG